MSNETTQQLSLWDAPVPPRRLTSDDPEWWEQPLIREQSARMQRWWEMRVELPEVRHYGAGTRKWWETNA